MALGFGYQKSSSNQEAQSEGPLGRGTPAELTRRSFVNLLTDAGLGASRQGEYGGGLFNQLFQRTQAAPTYAAPTLTASGLLPEQQNAFSEAVNQAMSRVSGNFANRGFLRPENIQAIAGSAAQNVAPGFAPMIAQNVAQRTQEPLIREDITRNRFNDLLQALGIVPSALGGTSASIGKSSSFGVQGQASAGEAGAGKIFCWIAGALYGDGSSEQRMIREWLLRQAERSLTYRFFVAWYAKYGKRVAYTMPDHGFYRSAWKVLFNAFLRCAERERMALNG